MSNILWHCAHAAVTHLDNVGQEIGATRRKLAQLFADAQLVVAGAPQFAKDLKVRHWWHGKG
jgi:hypothetical protein